MNPMLKWIGGASLVVALLFASATVAGYALEAEEPAPQLAAGDVLNFDAIPDGESDPVAGAFEPEATEHAEPAPELGAASNEPFIIKRILPIDGPIKYGEWHWDDAGVPDGPLMMTVDLDARVLSVFRDGYEIGATAVLLGTQDHPTPLGAFPILEKDIDHVSNLYDAPMPHMLRLTWDGITIHGSPVENGYASHGCIGTPDDFAAKLFAIAKKGDIVIITRGKTTGVGKSLVEG